MTMAMTTKMKMKMKMKMEEQTELIGIEDRYLCREEQTAKRQRIGIEEYLSSAGSPKYEKRSVKMVCASIYLPKQDPKKPRGEDAHFVCSDSQTVGVADGVGGWAKFSIDSGEYARDLMADAALLRDQRPVDPTAVLREAHRSAALSDFKGSSTACVLSHSRGVLRSANVGDSGFIIFRHNRLFYRSVRQQRGFNCPYQLGTSKRCDRPDCAAEAEIEVAAGDVVVVATDGFLDNVFPSEVEEILNREPSDPKDPDGWLVYLPTPLSATPSTDSETLLSPPEPDAPASHTTLAVASLMISPSLLVSFYHSPPINHHY